MDARQQITVTIPMPDRRLHPNGRVSSVFVKAKLAKKLRYDTGMAAMAAMIEAKMFVPRPKWDRVTVLATFYKPGSFAKAGDADGCIAVLKSAIDGIQDSQLIVNDSGVTWLPPIQILGREAGFHAKVEILITRQE